MASINRVILIGNLGKDPETKDTPSGMKITKFSIATSESYKKGDNWDTKTEWHNIVLFNKQAEYASDTLKKGMTIYLEGKISTNTWEDNTGKKNYRTEIIGNLIKNLTTKRQGEYNSSEPNSTFQTDKQDNSTLKTENDSDTILPF